VGFKVLTALVKRSSMFWDISPCSLAKVNQISSSGRKSKPSKKSAWRSQQDLLARHCLPGESFLYSTNLPLPLFMLYGGFYLLGYNAISLLKVNRRFRTIFRLNVQGWRISHAEIYLSPAYKLFLAWLILRLWRWRQYVPPKRRLTYNELHSVTSSQPPLWEPQILHMLMSFI
jgi:hypothetical protein